MFTDKMLQLVGVGILETFYMTLSATALAYLIGLPLGLVLVISDPAGIHPMPKLNKVLGAIINFLRAAPFLILLMLLIPFTRLLIGTTIGASAMVPPLFIAAFPFVARMVESSVKEVDAGVVEAAQSMGASTAADCVQGAAARGKALAAAGRDHRHHHHFGLLGHGRYRGRRRPWRHRHQLWLLSQRV